MNRFAEISTQVRVGAGGRGDLEAISSAVTDHRRTPLDQLDGAPSAHPLPATRTLGPTFNSAI